MKIGALVLILFVSLKNNRREYAVKLVQQALDKYKSSGNSHLINSPLNVSKFARETRLRSRHHS